MCRRAGRVGHTGKAEAIVTGDADLLADEALREWLALHGTEVLSPAELLVRLGR